MITNRAVEDVFEEYSLDSLDDELDLISLTRRGITKKTLLEIAEMGSLSLNDLADLLPVSERTIKRYKSTQTLKPDISEHALLIARVFAKAYNVFESKDRVTTWLRSPLLALDKQTPLSLLDTSFGSQVVLDILGRIEHGVHS